MVDLAAFTNLDRVIHEPGRLAITSLLAATDSLSFKELKEQLRMTDGNLSVHMRTLEENGYVAVSKTFVNRKPRTEYSLTPAGRAAFQEYLGTLAEIVRQSQEPVAAPARVHTDNRTGERPPRLQQGLAPAK